VTLLNESPTHAALRLVSGDETGSRKSGENSYQHPRLYLLGKAQSLIQGTLGGNRRDCDNGYRYYRHD
jgi:hypothetical protein